MSYVLRKSNELRELTSQYSKIESLMNTMSKKLKYDISLLDDFRKIIAQRNNLILIIVKTTDEFNQMARGKNKVTYPFTSQDIEIAKKSQKKQVRFLL